TNSELQSITFSPDGTLVADAGGIRGVDIRIHVLRARDGELQQSLTTSNSYGVRLLAFSPDGRWLAAGSYESDLFAGAVEIWSTSDWTQRSRLPVAAPSVAFLPGGNALVTIRDRNLDFWSVPDGIHLQGFKKPETGLYGRHYA